MSDVDAHGDESPGSRFPYNSEASGRKRSLRVNTTPPRDDGCRREEGRDSEVEVRKVL